MWDMMGRKEEIPSRGNFDGVGLLMELKHQTEIAMIRAVSRSRVTLRLFVRQSLKDNFKAKLD